MKKVFYRSMTGLLRASLVVLLLTSLARGEKGLEEMDLAALAGEAAQLQKQLDRNPSDYEGLFKAWVLSPIIWLSGTPRPMPKRQFKFWSRPTKINPRIRENAQKYQTMAKTLNKEQ